MSRIAKILSNLVLLVLVGASLLVIFSRASIPGNYRIFTVLSGSMEPAVPVGSAIIVKPQSEYFEGDIVTRPIGPESTLTHRVVEKKDGNGVPAYRLKGDNNREKDTGEYEAEQFIGKVVYTVPYLGYFLNTVKSKIGFISLIVLPTVLVILEESINIYQALRKKKSVPMASAVKIRTMTPRPRRAFYSVYRSPASLKRIV